MGNKALASASSSNSNNTNTNNNNNTNNNTITHVENEKAPTLIITITSHSEKKKLSDFRTAVADFINSPNVFPFSDVQTDFELFIADVKLHNNLPHLNFTIKNFPVHLLEAKETYAKYEVAEFSATVSIQDEQPTASPTLFACEPVELLISHFSENFVSMRKIQDDDRYFSYIAKVHLEPKYRDVYMCRDRNGVWKFPTALQTLGLTFSDNYNEQVNQESQQEENQQQEQNQMQQQEQQQQQQKHVPIAALTHTIAQEYLKSISRVKQRAITNGKGQITNVQFNYDCLFSLHFFKILTGNPSILLLQKLFYKHSNNNNNNNNNNNQNEENENSDKKGNTSGSVVTITTDKSFKVVKLCMNDNNTYMKLDDFIYTQVTIQEYQKRRSYGTYRLIATTADGTLTAKIQLGSATKKGDIFDMHFKGNKMTAAMLSKFLTTYGLATELTLISYEFMNFDSTSRFNLKTLFNTLDAQQLKVQVPFTHLQYFRIETTTATATNYHQHVTWHGKSYDMPFPILVRSSLNNHKIEHEIYTSMNEMGEASRNKKPTLIARICTQVPSPKYESWPIILKNKRLIDLMIEFNFQISTGSESSDSKDKTLDIVRYFNCQGFTLAIDSQLNIVLTADASNIRKQQQPKLIDPSHGFKNVTITILLDYSSTSNSQCEVVNVKTRESKKYKVVVVHKRDHPDYLPNKLWDQLMKKTLVALSSSCNAVSSTLVIETLD